MLPIQPPKLLDLAWLLGTTTATAPATELFWKLYSEEKLALKRAGITVAPVDVGAWQVVFNPKYSQTGVQRMIDLMLLDHQDAEAARLERIRLTQESIAAIKARRDADAADLKRRHDEVLAQRLGPAIEAGRQMLIRYAEFVDRKDKVRSIIERFDDPDAEALGINDLNVLEDAIQSTKNKHSRTLVRALKAAGGVDWTDDEVVEAIEILTLRDADHAAVQNHLGWNKSDSSLGHWCYAMLASNRDAAIKLGRTLVGKYAATQLGRAA